MAIEDDVLVIGGGLAGVTAALAAAREGAGVRLVSHKEGSLRQASGLVDALGVVDGEFVADPFAAVDRLPETHPYRTVGKEAISAGFSLFDEVVDGYRGHHTEANALVVTHGGTVKPTARYPDSVAPGVASDGRPTLFVGFDSLTDFDAPLATDHLERVGVPFDVRGVTVPFPGDLRPDAKPTRYANVFDEALPVDTGDRGALRALADRVAEHLGDAERVGFPAVLGHARPEAVREALEAELGVDVFEVPMGPPSLLGIRLQEQLYAALDEAGVRVQVGNPVVSVDATDGRITSVEAEHTHTRVPYAAAEYVLATGGLVGKGLDSDRERVTEPVFGCHVPQPDDRYGWSDAVTYGDHAFARFGVDIDDESRPLAANGTPEFENLRAGGAVVGGADFPAEKSGSGVSLATGYAAGKQAGEAATKRTR